MFIHVWRLFCACFRVPKRSARTPARRAITVPLPHQKVTNNEDVPRRWAAV